MRRAEGRGLLLILGLIVGLAFQGSRGLYETTEGRYAEAGREMLETGDWLDPQLDYQPHWSKPPATYWTVAGGLALAGRNAWGARLGNALAFALTGLAVAALGALLWDSLTGFLAGLVYLTSLFPVAGAAGLSTDTLLTLAETLAVLAYVRAWRADSHGARAAVFAMWLAFGLAFLVKGPPGLLPLLPLAVFHVRAGRPFRMLDPYAMALGAVVGLGWYVLEVVRTPGLLEYLLGQEVVARNLTDSFGRNPQWWAPFTIYLPVLLLGPGIWIVDSIRAARHVGLPRLRGLRSVLTARQSPAALLLLWIALPLLVFSLSRSRLALYVLPLYAPIALASARGIALSRDHPRRHAIRLAVAGGALLIAVKGLAAVYPSDSDMRRLGATVRAVAGPEARVATFDEPRLFGLQFYLGGELTRVATGPTDDARSTVAALVTGPGTTTSRPLVIVTRARSTSSLDSALAATHLPVRTSSAGKWRLRVIDHS